MTTETSPSTTLGAPTQIAGASRPIASSGPRDAARIDDPELLLSMLCASVEETKAHDITVLDVRGQTIVTDFFVLCSGTSTTHIQAIAQNVVGKLRVDARRRAKPEGDSESLWIVLDYSDVILHVFDAETRDFYDLERLWGDAKVTRLNSAPNQSPASESTLGSSVGSNVEQSKVPVGEEEEA